MKVKLKGDFETRRVWLNGTELLPDKSFRIRKHSPDGFAWGYSGSGPAQLSLAICLELFGLPEYAERVYQDFKTRYIAVLPEKDFDTVFEISPQFFKTHSILLTTPL